MGAPGSLDFETWWDGQTEETEPGQALLRVFKGVLQAPETVEERGSTIAQGVIQFILADTPDHDIAAKFWVLWSDWIDMISDIPHGHEWHECLAHAFELIRTDKGIAGTENRQVCLMSLRPPLSLKPLTTYPSRTQLSFLTLACASRARDNPVRTIPDFSFNSQNL